MLDDEMDEDDAVPEVRKSTFSVCGSGEIVDGTNHGSYTIFAGSDSESDDDLSVTADTELMTVDSITTGNIKISFPEESPFAGFSADVSLDEESYCITLMNNGETLGNLSVSVAPADESISFDITDFVKSEEYLSGCSFEKILENAKNASVPEEFLNILG